MIAIGCGVGLLAMLWTLASTRVNKAAEFPGMYFRAGVGAVVVDPQKGVLTFERRDTPGARQLPQGGIESGEDAITAVYREIEEETGLRRKDIELLDRYPEPLVYELPPEAQSLKTGVGQVQHWFYFQLRTPLVTIAPPLKSELRNPTWLAFDTLIDLVVDFREPIYRRLHAFLAERTVKRR